MRFVTVSAPARSARRAPGLAAVAGALALLAVEPSVAQQATPPQKQAQAQSQPRQNQQRAQPQQRPAQQSQPSQAPAGAPATPPVAATPPLIYSPWTKVCGKEGPPNSPNEQKQVCFTIKEARLDTGQFVASAGLIELDGEPKKILRVTLPLGLLLRHGTRMIVDSNQPMMGVYNFCLPNGCWADFEVNQDFVGTLKKGQNLVLQAFNLNGQVASFTFPLTDFAKANEGPPTDPKVLEEQQKKLQEELQKRAEEARKKLEQQQQQGQPPKAQ